MNKDQMLLFVNATESAGYSVRSYSGRGMYGKQCLGIGIGSGISPFKVACEIAMEVLKLDDQHDIVESLMADLSDERVAQDSLGMGTIIYFPNMKWKEREEPELDLDAAREAREQGGVED